MCALAKSLNHLTAIPLATASLSTYWAAFSATLAPTPIASPDSADFRIDLAVLTSLLSEDDDALLSDFLDGID